MIFSNANCRLFSLLSFSLIFLLTSCDDDDGQVPTSPDPVQPSPFVQTSANSSLTDNRLGIGTIVNLSVVAGDTSEVVDVKEIRFNVSGVNAATFPIPADSLTIQVPPTSRFRYTKLFEFDETFLQNIGLTTITVTAISSDGGEASSDVVIETMPSSAVNISKKSPTPYGDSLATPFVFTMLPQDNESPRYIPEVITDNPFYQADMVYYLNSTDGAGLASIAEAGNMFSDLTVLDPKHTMFVMTALTPTDFQSIGEQAGQALENHYNNAAAMAAPAEKVAQLAVGDVIAFRKTNGRHGLIWVEEIKTNLPSRMMKFDMKTQY